MIDFKKEIAKKIADVIKLNEEDWCNNTYIQHRV